MTVRLIADTPIKLSGLTSVKAFFPYDPDLVEAVKSLPGPCLWHKSIGCWEFPTADLCKALDAFVAYTDVELVAPDPEPEEALPPLTPDEIASFKARPFSHQAEAVDFGLAHKGWLLLDSMGLGKTAEAIYLAETLHRRGLLEHCLIICGVDSLRQNWKAEIERFSDLPVRILGERRTKSGKATYATLKERAAELRAPTDAFFVIANAANVGDDSFVEAFRRSANRFGLIVVDEAHRMATKGSARGKNLLRLDAERKVAMTGTLITNSPVSAYLPLSWIGVDKATLTNFKSQYCEFGGFHDSQIIGYKDLSPLNEEIASCSLRRTFDEVRGDMPRKTVEYELVEQSDSDRRFYEAIKEGVKEEADRIELNANNLLALMTRLRQATACPSALSTDPPESSKLTRAAELAEDVLASGEKVLVLSVFRESAYALAKALEARSPLIATGDQSESDTQAAVDRFRKDPDANLLIATHAKLGTGFSMPECHYMICLDTPYTAAQLDQSIDRIYRITSDQPVFAKILCCKDTVDERVRAIVETKRDLADFMVDGKPSPRFVDELRDAIRGL